MAKKTGGGKMKMNVADTATEVVVRVVEVNRDREPRQAFAAAAAGRQQCVTEKALDAIPKGGYGNQRVTVKFFSLGRYASDEEVAREYQTKKLKPDPYAVMAVNEAELAFADQYPNSTLWQDEDGNWCHISFYKNGSNRYAGVDRIVNAPFGSGWWFGGTSEDNVEDNAPGSGKPKPLD